MRSILSVARVFIAAVLFATSAHAVATPLTFSFTANVMSMGEGGADGQGLIDVLTSSFAGTPISIGNTFRGTFTIDPNASMSTGPDRYIYTGGAQGLTFSGNGVFFYDAAQDSYKNQSMMIDRTLGFPGVDGFRFTSYRSSDGMLTIPMLNFVAWNTEKFSGSQLPTELNLADFMFADFYVNWIRESDNFQLGLSAEITSLTLVQQSEVPEPATWGLWILAGSIIVALRRNPKLTPESAVK